MINRAAVIFKYNEPAIKWINDADPIPDSHEITEHDVNNERTVYLVSNETADTPESLEKWLKINYKTIFENELEGWYLDPTLWPEKRNYGLFKKWFTVECHTVIEDTDGTHIYDEDA